MLTLKYGIHRNILWLKLKGRHERTPGHPTVFTETEEQAFVYYCLAISNYGFPLTGFDLRCIVKSYLDRVGHTVTCFKNNFPGVDWHNSFMAGHRILTQRFTQNISTARAAVDKKVINPFFYHLESEIEGVPGSNIWNYNETNLVDDAGSSKIITKRGKKYLERIQNSTKSCTSVMFCGNAEGKLAPIYINYKSKHLWGTWIEGGPAGERYNCTSSGWFDCKTFEGFFMNTMLPILRRQDGPKVLIGDNLSSHLNLEVIRKCGKHNMSHSTTTECNTPIARSWKIILAEWKETAAGLRTAMIHKQEFPNLLKKLVEKIEENQGKNLSSGFRKAGIHPLNREEVLNRLYGHVQDRENESVKENVTALLNI
ncbi:hypothetical protein J437_LFUL008584 [Ladona fulva]|uniref:DDE-1 domain-containing protein n=1 Tax=Ladona fulva TaxID=123851 RepID=A0A8K0K799_LADFU|nr:hypothetical protein J437_LFUL008584 [Ladona fulva]